MLSRSRRGISRGGGLVPRNLSATPVGVVGAFLIVMSTERTAHPCSVPFGATHLSVLFGKQMLVFVAHLGRSCFATGDWGRAAPFGSQCRRSSHGSTDGRCSGRTCGSDRHGGCRRGCEDESHVSFGSQVFNIPFSKSSFMFVRVDPDSDTDFSFSMGSVCSYQERAPLP